MTSHFDEWKAECNRLNDVASNAYAFLSDAKKNSDWLEEQLHKASDTIAELLKDARLSGHK